MPLSRVFANVSTTPSRRALGILPLALVLCTAACGVTESLGITAASNRGLVGNTIVFDDFVGGSCGINDITVTVTDGSYASSDVTKWVPGDLTGINNGYWTASNVPTGTTVTIMTSDSYGQLQAHGACCASVREHTAAASRCTDTTYAVDWRTLLLRGRCRQMRRKLKGGSSWVTSLRVGPSPPFYAV